MAEEIIVQPQPHAWLERSILQPYVLRFGAHLHRGRYAPTTRRVYLCCIAHFAHWLTSERYTLNAVNEAAVVRFVSEHLPSCRCPYPARRLIHENRAALARLLDVLRADGVIVSGIGSRNPVGGELVRFDTHMQNVEGLAANTRHQRSRIIGRFLFEQFGSRPINLSMISASTIRCFVLGEERDWSAGTIRVMGGAIGCYLRFRSVSGDRVAQLLAAIPRSRALALGVIAGGALRCRDRRTAPFIRSVRSGRIDAPYAMAAVPHRSRPEMQRSRQASARRYQLERGDDSPRWNQDPARRYPPVA